MPGELGNEEESQQVGYHGHWHKPTGEFMDDDRFVQEEDDSKKRQTQQERLMRRWKKKYYQPVPESSGLPDGGPSQAEK